MSNLTFFLFFVPILTVILLIINFLLAEHKPNRDKDSQFECGFSSFTEMSRLPFSISFFIYALLFLLFDLEILLVYPYVVSNYNNSSYGLVVMLVFFILLTIGFVFELGRKALQIDSRQNTEKLKLIGVIKPKLIGVIKPKYDYIKLLCSSLYFLVTKYYIQYNLLIARVTAITILLMLDVFLINILYEETVPLQCASPEPEFDDDDNAHGFYYINGSENSNNNASEQVTQPHRRPIRVWRNMFFTMGDGERNFWFNIYNAEDRIAHINAVKRLDINKQVWDELEFDERVETRVLIDRTMEQMRTEEYKGLCAARELQQRELQEKYLESIQQEKYLESIQQAFEKKRVDEMVEQEALRRKGDDPVQQTTLKRKRVDDVTEQMASRPQKKLKANQSFMSITGFTSSSNNPTHDPLVGSSKFDYTAAKRLINDSNYAADNGVSAVNNTVPDNDTIMSNNPMTSNDITASNHPPLTSENLVANNNTSSKCPPASPSAASSNSGCGTTWSFYSSLNGNETPRTLQKKLEGLQNTELLKWQYED